MQLFLQNTCGVKKKVLSLPSKKMPQTIQIFSKQAENVKQKIKTGKRF
jgi:hypothetical protein